MSRKKISRIFAVAAAVMLAGCSASFAQRMERAQASEDFAQVFNTPVASLAGDATQQAILRDMLHRHEKQMQDPLNRETLNGFLSHFDHLKGANLYEILAGANAIVDASIAYAMDYDLHRRLDVWSTPLETVLRKKGDCEDSVILKLAVLKYLGLPQESLRLVTLSGEKGHAVLMADTTQGAAVLDIPLRGMKRGKFLSEDAYTPYMKKEKFDKVVDVYGIRL